MLSKKKVFFALSLILMLVMTLMMAFVQSSLAQVGIAQPEKTVGYSSVAPLLVGVGQNATVNLWVFPLPTTYAYQPYFKGFSGVTVTFVKPDGSKDTFMPVDGTSQYVAGQTSSLGSIYFFYAPDMAGNWSVSFTMPAQNITDKSGTVMYTGCTSSTAYFTVQTDPVNAGLLNGWPWSPLPEENTFWSYPINSNNREWWAVSGDWIGGGYGVTINGATSSLWQPYGSAPNTAHIVWEQPLKAGGLIGGDYGSLSYASAIGGFNSIPIMAGKVFINIPNENKFECIELATGKILYTMDGQITCGLHLPGNPYAQSVFDPSVVLASSYGATPTAYLFGAAGTTWNYYDPFTGTLMMSINNVTSSTGFFGAYRLIDGTNIAYGTTASGSFYAWNLSKIIENNFLTSFGRPAGSVLTGSWPTGIMWTKPLPVSLTGVPPSFFGVSTDASTIVLYTYNQYWGFSAKDGSSLWNLTLTYPVATNEETSLYGVNNFIVFDPVETTWHCYSMLTGDLLWTSPSFKDSPWATTWTVYNSETTDCENLYLMFPDGTMTALSLKTGEMLWRSEAFPSTEYTNNAVPFVIGMVGAGGNLYGYAGYSTGYQINPIPRQAMLVCVNATTGDITYTLNGGVYPSSAANGYLIGSGIYDGNLYCLGKGQTSTTVTALQQVGGSMLIQGSVLDQSAAQPNTAAISDADMSVWMDYMHMQNATLLNNPPKCNGVPVTLTAVDPNGNTVTIGTTTSNYQGNYGFQWTPTNAGVYTIYATFQGSDSYYPSSASTYATVASSSPLPIGSLAPVSNSDLITYLVIGVVAIIISIIIVGVIILRKKD